MAKGLGLIGNFRGKFGNAVGYNLKDSNNKQTQGIRIYQPIVKNPKTYAQAKQRARMAAINATYRLLKDIIDRGQEGIAYGNKSRLAWLKTAMKAFDGPWFQKGAVVYFPAIVPLSKGSLATGIVFNRNNINGIIIPAAVEKVGTLNIGTLSQQLIAKYPGLKAGDQLTFVNVVGDGGRMVANVDSVVIDTTSTDTLPTLCRLTTAGVEYGQQGVDNNASLVIVSREGDKGQHLRSTAAFVTSIKDSAVPIRPEQKEAAIRSYMAAGATTDWPQEPIED